MSNPLQGFLKNLTPIKERVQEEEDPNSQPEEQPNLRRITSSPVSSSNNLSDTSTNPSTSLFPSSSMSSEAKFGNFCVKITNTAQTVTENDGVLFKKEDRASMSPEKLQDLFEKATSTKHKKYDFINLTLNDDDKLDDTYNLDMLIRKTRNSHVNYDMHDVFTIVLLDPNDPDGKTIVGIKDLYKDFSDLTIEDVAHSNRFYQTWAEADTYKQNLKLTYGYFQSNVSEELWEKTFEKYDDYGPEFQGGPLFFILMLSLLLSNSEEAADTLYSRIKEFKLTALRGEDVTRAMSLLKGAIRRLIALKCKNPKEDADWFMDITKLIVKVMQTSSVPEFNALFQMMDQQRKLAPILFSSAGVTQKLSYDQVFSLAEQTYVAMIEAGTWTGITTKGSDSVFTSSVEPVCWNCGGNHHLNKCPKPKNQKRIQENRKKFLAQRKSGRNNNNNSSSSNSSRGKWANPKPEERGRRVIDGKPYYFHHKSKRWVLDKDANKEGTVPPAINVSQKETETEEKSPEESKPGAPDDASQSSARKLALANATKKFSDTVSVLMSQID